MLEHTCGVSHDFHGLKMIGIRITLNCDAGIWRNPEALAPGLTNEMVYRHEFYGSRIKLHIDIGVRCWNSGELRHEKRGLTLPVCRTGHFFHEWFLTNLPPPKRQNNAKVSRKFSFIPIQSEVETSGRS
ncbi:hypothetical protein RvY_15252 [Ramazzottius varieornatus]|uniref:Uncharacterized protein n=1 Tax=Ramazzottius varieornatus TaxID=947166 RepID=A0A1D1VVV7_RAMVA|nr:hypothetical protein RvY_15252 [Ramazzottius varieornatus]